MWGLCFYTVVQLLVRGVISPVGRHQTISQVVLWVKVLKGRNNLAGNIYYIFVSYIDLMMFTPSSSSSDTWLIDLIPNVNIKSISVALVLNHRLNWAVHQLFHLTSACGYCSCYWNIQCFRWTKAQLATEKKEREDFDASHPSSSLFNCGFLTHLGFFVLGFAVEKFPILALAAEFWVILVNHLSVPITVTFIDKCTFWTVAVIERNGNEMKRGAAM